MFRHRLSVATNEDGRDRRGSLAPTSTLVPSALLDAAGRVVAKPRSGTPTGPERVVVHRPPALGGAEVWTFENSARLWSVFHTNFTFCAMNRLQGRRKWQCRGRTYDGLSGHTAIMEPGDVHVTVQADGADDLQALVIRPADLETMLGGPVRFNTGHVDDTPGLAHEMATLVGLIQAGDNDPMELQDQVMKFLGLAVSRAALHGGRKVAENGNSRAVARAKEYIQDRHTERVSLDDLERETGVSKFHLARTFRASLGLPPHQFLKRVRLARAMDLMRRGSRPSEVAHQTGFADQPHLTRVFRSDLGLTPYEFWTGRGPRIRALRLP